MTAIKFHDIDDEILVSITTLNNDSLNYTYNHTKLYLISMDTSSIIQDLFMTDQIDSSLMYSGLIKT
jgi:hypothetical protein